MALPSLSIVMAEPRCKSATCSVVARLAVHVGAAFSSALATIVANANITEKVNFFIC